MTMPGKSLIAKAVFAVAIVATTATVGIVGFAQAARPNQDGYGGGIDQLIAAINTFRQEVQTATTTYRQDVDVCLGTSPLASARSHARAFGAEAGDAQEQQADNATNSFKQRLNQTVGGLDSQVTSPRKVEQGSSAFQKAYDNATGQVFAGLDNSKGQFAAELGANNRRVAQQGGLFDCLQRAQNKYHRALDAAKAELLAAIRRILG